MLRVEHIQRTYRRDNPGVTLHILLDGIILISFVIIIWDLLPFIVRALTTLHSPTFYYMNASSLSGDYPIFTRNHGNQSVKTNAAIFISLHNPDYVTRLIRERFDLNRTFLDEILRPVQYLLVPTQQHTSHLSIVILVLSQIHDFRSRNYWRQTYASPENQAKFGYSVIFPVGNSADAGVQRRLQVEADSYGDILQAHFVDSYRNLSLKMLSSFRYLSLTFPKEMAVLKVDSDVAWRIHDVVSYIRVRIDNSDTAFHCYRIEGAGPSRSRNDKWYVSMDEYPSHIFPPFCLGWSYIATLPAINYVLQHAHLHKFFWLEDVFITGILNHGRSTGLIDMGHDKFFRTRTNISYFDGAWLLHLRGRDLSIPQVYRLLNEDFRG